jgi:hypothetical protein
MNKHLKITSLVLVVLLLGTTILLGGNKDRVGTAAAPELLIPVGARGVALGGSMISNISGLDALYYNPAGLVRGASNFELMFSNMTYFADMNVIYLAASARAGSLGTFAVSLKSLSIGDINETTTDFPDGTGAVYSPSYVNLGVTYSTQLIDRVAVGATVTWISHKIMSTSESGMAINFGIQYVGLGTPGLSLGVALKNIGSSMRFEGSDLYQQAIYVANQQRPTEFLSVKAADQDLPTMIELGVGYAYKIDDQTNLNVTGNYMNAGLGDDEYRLGAEFGYDNMLFLRGGYNFVPDAAKDVVGNSSYLYSWAAGAGYKADLGGASLSLDYTYQNMKIFNGNHVITLTLGF